jgi:hypothetical protein
MIEDEQRPLGSGFTAASTAADVMADIDLIGRTALVTGGYSGLGFETTKALASAGCAGPCSGPPPGGRAGGAG